MLTNNEEIQDRIDSAIKEQEVKNSQLNEQFKSMSVASGSMETEVKIPPTLSFQLGNSRYPKQISSKVDFSTLFDKVTDAGDRGDFIGYTDQNSRDIWLRNDRDLHACFLEHSAAKNFPVVFKTMRKSDLPAANFEGESTEGVTFKLAIDKIGDTLIFASLPTTLTRDDGISKLQQLSGKTAFAFIDSDGDKISLESEIEWTYFLKDCETHTKKGKYCLVLSS